MIDEQGAIRACYEKSGADRGEVRLLVKGKCTRQERAIAWNREGVPGEPGSDAQFTGAAAGGALAGSYPDPELAPGVVGISNFTGLPAAAVSSSQQTIPNDNGIHVLAADKTEFDNAGIHDSVQNSRLVVPAAGLYLISATVAWNSNPTGRRLMAIRKTGSSFFPAEERVNASTMGVTSSSVSQLVQANAGESFEVITDVVGANAPVVTTLSTFSLNWVGPA